MGDAPSSVAVRVEVRQWLHLATREEEVAAPLSHYASGAGRLDCSLLAVGQCKVKPRPCTVLYQKRYGRYVDIVCTNGMWIDMGWIASGTSSERFTHEVRYAEGTYFVVVDYGKLVNPRSSV